ncbi:ABC transporter family protein [Yersinia pseudotuberculosis IP 32953]|uniref:ABC sugar transporter, ATP binding subunit n=2 Tax=Yersinia pseudotuberculosis TaxID=633 RepID=Q66B64_YERPS|nr:sn-glycerol-3-phosphate ABC transporter ATP-binding protein UgpC [Yersinia pseudotuberculosis]CQD53203.1 carbohydrate ABC transporter ATP-binding protein [Yersinia intermedia]AJJ03077.1 ABC transporter family protein [Yersinia pseudotuberculosis]AJJ53854.1 ABC transporter family protein [Yersinia pseudotuberculosis IP 32953]AJJ58785.1 ABC transporter family protein [Yersinia pseudotuberculosis YPIII]AJJ68429.1 ABC transporter family protein [Yersinia pseudotuberculosis PB1/+]
MSGIRLSNVFKRFHDTQVINQVDLEIKNGEFCVFIGPSGCGKSTLLRMIAGLETISSGEISIGDKVVNKLAPADRGVAMVFQSYALYPHMTIYDNMAFNLKLAKTEPAEIERRVLNAAKILQLELLLQRLPKALSGGQRQRVAIGRAIVRNPDVFLFDEPLSNLDASLRVATRVEIAKLHHQLGNTMVYVTHDQVEAMTLADKIVLLNSGAAMLNEGSIAQTGHPLELYHHPVNEFVAGFIGSPKMNFLSGELVAGNAQCASIRLGGVREIEVQVDTAAARSGEHVKVGIRPEHLRLCDQAEAHLIGQIQHIEHLGEAAYFYVSVNNFDPMLVRHSEDQELALGDDVGLMIPAHHAHLFDNKGVAFRRTASAVQKPFSTA